MATAGVSGRLNTTPNLLVRLDENLVVTEEIPLPDDVTACRAAMVAQAEEAVAASEADEEDDALAAEADRTTSVARNLRYGFEGVTVDGDGIVHVAQQRGWEFDAIPGGDVADCSTLNGDNGDGAGEQGVTKIWSFDPDSGDWASTGYQLDPRPARASWVGLSEITWNDGHFVFIERDNRTGDWATIKTLTRVDEADVDGGLIEECEQTVADLLPAMLASNGWISDKPEGTAITADGQVYVITDNDGVDDWSGETLFLRLGDVDDLFTDGE